MSTYLTIVETHPYMMLQGKFNEIFDKRLVFASICKTLTSLGQREKKKLMKLNFLMMYFKLSWRFFFFSSFFPFYLQMEFCGSLRIVIALRGSLTSPKQTGNDPCSIRNGKKMITTKYFGLVQIHLFFRLSY